MILVVNLNLSIDKIIELDQLTVGGVHRATNIIFQAGGKGVNVVRMLKTLGESCELIGFIGGRTGDDINSELEREGVRRTLIKIPGESRTSTIILTKDSQTVINENGPTIETTFVEQALVLFSERVAACDMAVLTGSVPPGIRSTIYRKLIEIANQAGKPTLLDASGPLLIDGLYGAPTIAKPNQHEASVVVKRPIDSVTDASEAAKLMLTMGAKSAAITLGKDGMMAVSAGEAFWVKHPGVQVVNAVGSGDATAAGFASAYIKGLPLIESAKLAVACGTASVKHGFGRCSLMEIKEVAREIETILL